MLLWLPFSQMRKTPRTPVFSSAISAGIMDFGLFGDKQNKIRKQGLHKILAIDPENLYFLPCPIKFGWEKKQKNKK